MVETVDIEKRSKRREKDRGVVGAGGDGLAARVELDAVDVGVVALEGLHLLAGAHVPDQRRPIAALRTVTPCRSTIIFYTHLLWQSTGAVLLPTHHDLNRGRDPPIETPLWGRDPPVGTRVGVATHRLKPNFGVVTRRSGLGWGRDPLDEAQLWGRDPPVGRPSFSSSKRIFLRERKRTDPGDESVAGRGGAQVDGHDVGAVAVERLQHLARLDVPEGARRVARAGQDLLVRIGEEAARHVRRVRADRLAPLARVVLHAQRVHRHLVVQTPACG